MFSRHGSNPPTQTSHSASPAHAAGDSHTTPRVWPKWLKDLGSMLALLVDLFEEVIGFVGIKLPGLIGKIGLVAFKLIDTIANPIIMGYVTSRITPAEWRTPAVILASTIGIVWSAVNWKVVYDIRTQAPWTKQVGAFIVVIVGMALLSVLADGIVDASWVFIAANRFDVILSPGLVNFWSGFQSLPLIFQIFWVMTFIASNIADSWAAILETKPASPAKPVAATQPAAPAPPPAPVQPAAPSADQIGAGTPPPNWVKGFSRYPGYTLWINPENRMQYAYWPNA